MNKTRILKIIIGVFLAVGCVIEYITAANSGAPVPILLACLMWGLFGANLVLALTNNP